jgi:2-polyprenyl-3-methyl-5-hydroxy-6-metoxy-1,4-benzoquinol methylase
VLQAIGAKILIQETDPSALQQIVAEIRTTILQAAYLVNAEGPKPGWSHTDPALLSAIGEVSRAFASVLQKVVPLLDGLEERLELPDASYLEIGVGVGCLSIEMAHLWPSLHIVGVDLWAPSIAIARKNVADAGLESRIELRVQGAEDLPDRSTYDLCWIPSPFIRADLIPTNGCMHPCDLGAGFCLAS